MYVSLRFVLMTSPYGLTMPEFYVAMAISKN